MRNPTLSPSRLAGALLALSILGGAPATAQVDHDGALWEAWFGQGDLGALDPDLAGLRWWLDLHGRWRDDGDDLDTTIVRPGVGYQLNERFTGYIGYAWVETHPGAGGSRTEHRLWQQLIWSVQEPTYKLQFRSRLEQRFVEDADDTGWRLRQFAKYTTPFRDSSACYLSGWDEVFFDLNNTDFGQDFGLRQNRAFIGLGWFLDDARSIALEAGYLNQWLSRSGDDRMNHALSINLLMTF